jgi:hypothetical protein
VFLFIGIIEQKSNKKIVKKEIEGEKEKIKR